MLNVYLTWSGSRTIQTKTMDKKHIHTHIVVLDFMRTVMSMTLFCWWWTSAQRIPQLNTIYRINSKLTEEATVNCGSFCKAD